MSSTSFETFFLSLFFLDCSAVKEEESLQFIPEKFHHWSDSKSVLITLVKLCPMSILLIPVHKTNKLFLLLSLGHLKHTRKGRFPMSCGWKFMTQFYAFSFSFETCYLCSIQFCWMRTYTMYIKSILNSFLNVMLNHKLYFCEERIIFIFSTAAAAAELILYLHINRLTFAVITFEYSISHSVRNAF